MLLKMLGRLGFGLGLFFGSLLAGWWLGRRGWLTEQRANAVIRVVVKRLTPVILCLLFWRLDLTNRQLLLLPLIGCAVSCAALLPAWAYVRAAKLPGPQAGSFLTCAMFSNLGFLGAFVAFALWGETAYGISVLYMIYFTPCFYLLGFTIAKRYGQAPQTPTDDSALPERLRLYPFLGLLAGVALSLAKAPRPPAFELINQVLIPVDTALYLAAIGSQFRIEPIGQWRQACLVMSGIKFWYSPVVGWALVRLCHVEGVSRLVVLLMASMPVAISPLMLSVVGNLDRRLTSALWVCTTLLAIPWLLVYLPLLARL